jgi:hypothetical protein
MGLEDWPQPVVSDDGEMLVCAGKQCEAK